MLREKATRQVSFRLDKERAKKLDSLAGKAGVSFHEKARQMLMSALDERDEGADLVQLELAEARARQEQMSRQIALLETGTKESFIALFRGLQLAKTDEQARELVEFVFSQNPTAATKHR